MLDVIRGFARSPTLDRAAREAASAMATSLFHDGERNWRAAAMKGSKARKLYRLLMEERTQRKEIDAIIAENSKLIKSMTSDVARKVSFDMEKGQALGKRPEELMQDVLSHWPTLTESHARLIARTESSKATTALTRARAERAGLSWYVWRTSEDARVRSSHHHMDGVICAWSDPPSPERLCHQKEYGHYHPGNIFNCRCYPEPLLNYDDVSWPHKVYYGGRVQHMTLAKFKAINGGRDL